MTIRGDNVDLDITARDNLSQRQTTIIPVNQTLAWPATRITGGSYNAQFAAENLNNGNYLFTLWSSGSATGGGSTGPDLKFVISSGGTTLAEKTLPYAYGTDTVTVPKTGDNFNIKVNAA